MGCALPLCYGRSSCTECSQPIALMKEGTRKRLTFFCGSCQPADESIAEFLKRKCQNHRLVLPVNLTPCKCGVTPALQLFRRPGKHFGRLHAVCWKRQHANQPGCAGQHRKTLHAVDSGCNCSLWLDGCSSSLSLAKLPRCYCGEQPTLRRVMGLRDNAQIFARCAKHQCSWRLWLLVEERKALTHDTTLPNEEEDHGNVSAAASCPTVLSGKDSTAQRKMSSAQTSRWQRHVACHSHKSAAAREDLSDSTQGAKGTPVPKDISVPKRRRKMTLSCAVGPLRASSCHAEDTDDPLTSGEEDVEQEQLEGAQAHLQLLSLEESWARLASAKPDESAPAFQKRWRKAVL